MAREAQVPDPIHRRGWFTATSQPTQNPSHVPKINYIYPPIDHENNGVPFGIPLNINDVFYFKWESNFDEFLPKDHKPLLVVWGPGNHATETAPRACESLPVGSPFITT